MTRENNHMTVSQFDGNAYKSSQAAELTLNAAILRAEIARSYEEFLEIFDKFYADDVEVSSEDSPETVRGKERVRPFLSNFLVPLHVMTEVGGLSISVQQTEVPRDTANETHSGWRIDFTGVSGRRRSGLCRCLSFLLCSVSPMGNGERSFLDIGHLFVQQLDQFHSPLSTRLRCIATVHIVRQLSRAQAKKGERT